MSQENKNEKNDDEFEFNALVISILVLTGLSNSAYAIIAPFLPFKFEEKGID